MVYTNSLYQLTLQCTQNEINLYPRARIFYSGSRYIDQNPKDLSHISGGMYTGFFTPSTNGYYGIQYKVYSGSNHIVLSSDYGTSQEIIFVESAISVDLSTVSSQVLHLQKESNYISSQMTWISSNMVDAGTLAGSSQASHLMSESNYISSQVDSISGQLTSIAYKRIY